MKPKRPRILAVLPGIIPSTSILIIKPLLQLHRTGQIQVKITLESLTTNKELQFADLAVFCRNTEPRYASVLEIVQGRKIPYIYDLDDNFFDLPADTEVGRYHRKPERVEMLIRYLRGADLVRVYSEPMIGHARSFNQNAVKLFAPIDLAQIHWGKEKNPAAKIKLVYATSRGQQDNLADIFLPALSRILDIYRQEVEVHFWGMEPAGIAGSRNVHVHRYIGSYDQYLKNFSKEGHDVGLAPLRDDPFHRSKTNNKFREYGACGIAGIYSNVPVYASCVANEKTGLLISNDPESWYQAVRKLIDNPKLREDIQINSRKYVEQEYSQDYFSQIFMKQMLEAISQKRLQAKARRPEPELASDKGVETKRGHEAASRHPSSKGGVFKKIGKIIAYSRTDRFPMAKRLIEQYMFDRWTIFKLRILTWPFLQTLRGWNKGNPKNARK